MTTYTRIRPLQTGGQGSVWLCQSETGELAAVKYLLLTNEKAVNDERRRRFVREVKSQMSLQHPGVMPVLGATLDAEPPFFIMAFSEEGSLRGRLPLDADPPVPLAEEDAWRIFDQLLDVVAFAHENGVVHRDLKPENVLFYDGRAVISDFGMIKDMRSESTLLTASGMVLGTWGYIAPEQIKRSKDADARCDVYALGRMLHELLTGSYSPTVIDVMDVPPAYRHIISKATRVNPDDRFHDASEMRREFALLRSDSEDTQQPSERAATLVASIAAGDDSLVEQFVRLVIENDDDVVLLRKVVPLLPESVLSQIAIRDPEQYLALVQIFDRYADGSFAFEFTDTIARFLVAAYRASQDIRVHEVILNRILVLGATHNRFFVRNTFIELVDNAIKQPHYVPMVANLLRANENALDFVREPLRELSLPRAIVHVLAA